MARNNMTFTIYAIPSQCERNMQIAEYLNIATINKTNKKLGPT